MCPLGVVSDVIGDLIQSPVFASDESHPAFVSEGEATQKSSHGWECAPATGYELWFVHGSCSLIPSRCYQDGMGYET